MVNSAERWIVTLPTWKAGPVTTSICGNGTRCLASGKSKNGTLP